MPTLTEIFATGLIGAAIATSIGRLIRIWWMTRQRKLKVNLEMDTSSFTETVERLGQDMQRRVEEVIGDMSTEDIVRAMMGRRMTEQLDEELMTGVEATTETIPPGAIPYTTSHTRPPELSLQDSIERMATELVANEAIPWSEARRRAEENHTIEGTGPLPFIDPATGQYTDRDPALVLPDATAYEREQAALPGERATAPLLEWMLDSCRLCSQFVMTNTTIDDSEQAMLCGEGANEPCNVFGMWLAEPEPDEPPPVLYIWMSQSCPMECPRYSGTQDIHEHAHACQLCQLYGAWYHGGGRTREQLRSDIIFPELVEPPPVAEDLAPSDSQPSAHVSARCPWMDPAFCDGCRSQVPRLCPVDQAVRCAGEADPPGQGHRCNIFHTWSLTCSPGHPYLARLRSASACDRADLVRVIRFKK